MKKVLITGITGQDGSYLAELMLEKGYKVYGMNRRTSTPNYSRIKNIVDQVELVSGDLLGDFAVLVIRFAGTSDCRNCPRDA